MAVNFMNLGKMVPREQTTQSLLSVPPDVGIFCSKCREFIQVTKIRDHRAAHKALNIFGYRKMSQVKSMDQLALKRVELQQAIARGHRESLSGSQKDGLNLSGSSQQLNQLDQSKLPPTVLRAPGRPRPPNSLDTLVMAKREYLLIDEAYQIIRDYCFFDKSPFILKPKSEIRHCVGLPSLSPLLRAIGVASDQNEAFRPTMEDFRLLSDPFGPPQLGACLLGLFDGYNGTRAANFVCKSVTHLLGEELSKIDPLFCDELATGPMQHEDDWHKEMKEKADVLRMARDFTANLMSSVINRQVAKSAPPGRFKHSPIGVDSWLEHSSNHNNNDYNNSNGAPEKTQPEKADFGDLPESASAEELKTVYLRRALAKCLIQADKNLAVVGDETSLVRWSGCSATVALLLPEKYFADEQAEVSRAEANSTNDLVLLLANCGNAHVMLMDATKPRMLTEDHTVDNANEVKRVLERGGKITGTGAKKLVCGLLSTTRGIGNYGQPTLRKAISCAPFTCCRKISAETGQLIVFGTTGLWSVLSKNEVATIVMQTVTYCVAKAAKLSAERSGTRSQLMTQQDTLLPPMTGTSISNLQGKHETTMMMMQPGDVLRSNKVVEEEEEEPMPTVESHMLDNNVKESVDLTSQPYLENVKTQQVRFENDATEEAPKDDEERSSSASPKTGESSAKPDKTDVKDGEEKPKPPPWWERNATRDLPSVTAAPIDGSVLAEDAKANQQSNGSKPSTTSEPISAAMSSSATISIAQQEDIEAARTVALNLASAALLAGSQENISVQVLLLPNWRSLAEIHTEAMRERTLLI